MLKCLSCGADYKKLKLDVEMTMSFYINEKGKAICIDQSIQDIIENADKNAFWPFCRMYCSECGTDMGVKYDINGNMFLTDQPPYPAWPSRPI